MKKEIIITGYGGQGIMQAGNILIKAAILEDKVTTFFPSYGAEMRGGAANCKVIISDEFIGSPIVYKPDYVLCFSRLAFEKFRKSLKPDGLMFLNSDLVKIENNIDVLVLEANTLSEKFGSKIMANMAMLGLFIARVKLLKQASMEEAIKESFKHKGEKIVNLNIEVFRAGLDCV
ncbi:MAG: 2-oxoacid:ferredoxin oxidoreductase subunit gamma [bacterium]|nr:2-oxoacid:ferredoxin oxidoreductase subunit gamma [bacterium]